MNGHQTHLTIGRILHYAVDTPQSLHDSWVQSLIIEERPIVTGKSCRTQEIHVKLLGPDHDGYKYLDYEGVFAHSLVSPYENPFSGGLQEGHGDWLVEEVRLSEHGLVEHEIWFADQSN